MAIPGLEGTLHGSVLAHLLFGQRQGPQHGSLCQLRAERLGQVAHGLPAVRVLLPKPLPQLFGAVGFLAHLGNEGLDLVEGEGADVCGAVRHANDQ